MPHADPRNIPSRLDLYELPLCFRLNAVCRRKRVRSFFAIISRLGDGILWYSVIAALPLVRGPAGLDAALHLAGVGLLGVGVYKFLKLRLRRPRPFAVNLSIRPGTAPLDRYSFPSGHTLHATAFTLVTCSHFPSLVWLLVPFAVLIALSRIVLGLHYPSDVLAGAALGMSLAVPFLS